MAEWSADIDVSPERAARWIARRFPALAALPVVSAGEGWDNAVYRVGDALVFRVPRRRIGAELLAIELGLLPWLAPLLPVPVPVPIHVGAPDEDFPYPLAGYTWLDGTTADRVDPSDDDRAALAAPIAGFLRALHAVDPGPEARAADPGDTLGRADMARRLPTLLARLDEIAALPGVDRPAVAARLRALAETPPWPGPPVQVHGDLYARHLILDDRGALAGVIDWGDCHRGDPALDLSIGWSFVPPAAHAAFRAAYGGVDDDTWARARYRALHYGINLLRFGDATGDDAMSRIGRRALRQATYSGAAIDSDAP